MEVPSGSWSNYIKIKLLKKITRHHLIISTYCIYLIIYLCIQLCSKLFFITFSWQHFVYICYLFTCFYSQLHWLKNATVEEACEILMNEDLDSEDSLDYEIESDSSSVSYSENHSDPENDFLGRKILIPKQDSTMRAQGRPLNFGWWKVTTTSQGRVRKRGERKVQSLSRSPRARGRGPGTRGGLFIVIHY